MCWVSGYSKQDLDKAEIICYDIKIYVPQNLRICVLHWYHFYLNQPGGSILDKTIQWLCYWKGLGTKAELYDKLCKIYQQFKHIKNVYGRLSPNNISELKPWDTVNVDLIGLYSKSLRQHHLEGAIIKNNVSLTCMMMIEPTTGFF